MTFRKLLLSPSSICIRSILKRVTNLYQNVDQRRRKGITGIQLVYEILVCDRWLLLYSCTINGARSTNLYKP